MSGLLPSTSETATPDGDPRVVGVDSDDADQLLSALSSGTARSLYAALHDEPATPSELADGVDTSLQNAQYHLSNLEDADLIEECDTRYSAKGREMSVYAPCDAPVVLFAGSEEDGESVQTALSSLLGGIGVLGVASLVVQRVFGDGLSVPGAASGGGTVGQPGHTSALVAEGGETAGVAAQAASQGAGGLPVGLLFFLGGLLVVTVLAVAWFSGS
ncbi:ArsR/SmtB family transcription factor [Halobacterium jilantaiense]|uniref:Transcriptional regulator, ArsR family n=1 Tax=Halobacterium jilantaiense TaxID=355548 RepID=A0A1I0PL81_9EURY|nr:helix-turn-helix domain-containing protein [Halobacterium jilantaiense]SEW15156.1 transcriptional regulator, ArsR family [Halobacterium jilantaiense]